jgi:TolB-like protein
MATGRSAFAGTQQTTLEAILNREPPSPRLANPALPTELERIVARALEKNRKLRYQSAGDIKADLLRVERSSELDRSIRPRQKPHRIRPWAMAAVLAVLLTAAITAVLWRAGRQPPFTKADAPPVVKSIAVLPLENPSGDSQHEYLADGITGELIGSLSKVGSLRVIERSSVMKYKSLLRPLPEIAKELNVDAVLKGTLSASGDRLRLGAQLIDARNERILWENSYEGALAEVLALQKRMARAIIDASRVRLTAQEEQRLAEVGPRSFEAYWAYLRGKFYYGKSWGKEDNEAAIGMFERATTLNPEFAAAQAELARAYVYKHIRFESSPEIAARASAAAEKSLSLDPGLAEGYVARGEVTLMVLRSTPERAIADYRRALELNPTLPEAHWQLGQAYAHIGLFDSALAELNAARGLDPYSLRARYFIARIHLHQQDYNQALLDYEQSPDFSLPQLWEKVLILFYLGQKTAAYELIGELRRKVPENEDIPSTYAILLAADGRRREAVEQIRLSVRIGQAIPWHFHHSEYNIASAYALMGQRREALQWLRRSADDGLSPYPLYERDPNLNNLRGDPEFEKWLGEMRAVWERRRVALR